jgi:hypothetical protein
MHFSLRTSFGFAGLVSLAFLVACTATASDHSASSHSAISQGDPPPDDPDLAYVFQNGFGEISFPQTCVSKSNDGPTLDTAPLPVGNGRWLECTTDKSQHRSTLSALSSQGDEWCALGEASSFKGEGDPRLTVTVSSSPDDGPWTYTATHDGDEIEISPVAMDLGMAWPVDADITFTTVQMLPNSGGGSCDALFGL